MGGSDESELMALLDNARQGDERALNLLLSRMRPEAVRYLRHRLRSHPATDALAEELAQEVLIRMSRSIRSIRADTLPALRAWVRTTARRVAIDWHRKREAELGRRAWKAAHGVENRAITRALAASMAVAVDAGDDEIATILGRLLIEAQEVLSEGTRQVIRRRLLYGDTWAEAGEMIGTSAGGAKRRWQRAMARLRHEVRDRITEMDDTHLRRRLLERMEGPRPR